MNDDEWIDGAKALAAVQAVPEGDVYGSVRAALVLAYRLLVLAPARVTGEYCRIPEADLARDAAALFAALDRDDWIWRLPTDLESVVRSVAARVRALDRLLKQVSPHHGPPVDVEADYLCPATGWYVIPRLTSRVARPGHGGRSFVQQRGTLDHRLLPAKFGSYSVSLHWLNDVGSFQPDAPLGAAMFDDFRLEFGKQVDPHAFHAIGMSNAGADDAIRTAVFKANAEGCACLAWPELTMRPEVELPILRSALEDLAASSAPGGHPAFTLAGSWHVDGDRRRNVAPVLDFNGDTILKHSKTRPYADKAKRRFSRITPSRSWSRSTI